VAYSVGTLEPGLIEEGTAAPDEVVGREGLFGAAEGPGVVPEEGRLGQALRHAPGQVLQFFIHGVEHDLILNAASHAVKRAFVAGRKSPLTSRKRVL
jgi:hypothetical protein